MKKLLALLLFIVSLNNYAQITLENYYPTGGLNQNYLRLVKLSSSGYKYVISDQTKITLYNLNHAFFKTINFPALTGGVGSMPQIYYLSEELFNTNPADIEYSIFYTDTMGMFSKGHSAVIDELGNVLISKDSTLMQGGRNYGIEDFISYTPLGVKMIIWQEGAKGAFVYSLPGTLPCHDCTNGTTTSVATNNSGGANIEKISNYPNPTAGQTTIVYTLPQGIAAADLVIYDLSGQEIKRYKVTNAFNDVILSTTDLAAGTYYYQIQATNGYKAGKKMVVVK